MYSVKINSIHIPPHYQSSNGIEVIDVIEAFTEGLEELNLLILVTLLNIFCRWKKKERHTRFEKIIWYAQHLIDILEAKETNYEI